MYVPMYHVRVHIIMVLLGENCSCVRLVDRVHITRRYVVWLLIKEEEEEEKPNATNDISSGATSITNSSTGEKIHKLG